MGLASAFTKYGPSGALIPTWRGCASEARRTHGELSAHGGSRRNICGTTNRYDPFRVSAALFRSKVLGFGLETVGAFVDLSGSL